MSIIGEYNECQELASELYDLPGCFHEKYKATRIEQQGIFSITCKSNSPKKFEQALKKLIDKYNK